MATNLTSFWKKCKILAKLPKSGDESYLVFYVVKWNFDATFSKSGDEFPFFSKKCKFWRHFFEKWRQNFILLHKTLNKIRRHFSKKWRRNLFVLCFKMKFWRHFFEKWRRNLFVLCIKMKFRCHFIEKSMPLFRKVASYSLGVIGRYM